MQCLNPKSLTPPAVTLLVPQGAPEVAPCTSHRSKQTHPQKAVRKYHEILSLWWSQCQSTKSLGTLPRQKSHSKHQRPNAWSSLAQPYGQCSTQTWHGMQMSYMRLLLNLSFWELSQTARLFRKWGNICLHPGQEYFCIPSWSVWGRRAQEGNSHSEGRKTLPCSVHSRRAKLCGNSCCIVSKRWDPLKCRAIYKQSQKDVVFIKKGNSQEEQNQQEMPQG